MSLPFSSRRLYLCTPVRDDLLSFTREVVRGGVDVVQLRDKSGDLEAITRHGLELSALCRDLGVPFIMNDSVTLALATNADGVHVGQDDEPVTSCRALLGPDAIIGLSTHDDLEFAAALGEAVTYRSAGPIVPTPTKEGRPGTGIEYAVRCTNASTDPVFVTGGVDASTVGDLVRAGLRHFVVVRALTQAAHPYDAAKALRDALDEALDAVR